MDDKDLDDRAYQLLQDDTDRNHGEHILRITGDAERRNSEQGRALLDALGRARMAQETNPK